MRQTCLAHIAESLREPVRCTGIQVLAVTPGENCGVWDVGSAPFGDCQERAVVLHSKSLQWASLTQQNSDLKQISA